MSASERPDPGPRPDPGRGAGRSGQPRAALPLVGLCLSLLLHGVLALPALLPGLLPSLLPPLPISVEILAPKPALPPPRPAEPAAAPPEKPAAGSDSAAGPRGPGPRRGPRKAGPADRAPPTERLGDLGNADASVLVVLRMAPLRASPHRQGAAALLGAFPDTRILAAGVLPSGEALAQLLIEQADALFVTTTDPRDLTQSALLAFHGPALDLEERLRARRLVPWDPRALERLGAAVTIFARPEVRDVFRERLGADPDPQQAGLGPLLSGAAALAAEVRGLDRLVRLQDGLPTPQALRLSLSAEASPALRIQLEMQSEADAEAMEKALPPLLERLRDRLRMLSFGQLNTLLAGIKPARRGRDVTLGGRLPQGDTALLLGLVQLRLQLLPLPREVLPPPDLAPPPPEASTPGAAEGPAPAAPPAPDLLP